MNLNSQQSFTMQSSNPQSPRLFDHLEQIYNSDAFENKNISQQQKHLYSKLIQQNEKRKQEKISLEKQVSQFENQQIDIFWKNRENQLQARQRRRKQMVQEARSANNNMFGQKVLSKSMVMPTHYELIHKDYYEDMAKYENKRLQEKQHRQKFLSEGQMYNDFKQYQQSLQKQSRVETERKKLAENDEIERKRLQQLDKWRKKYLTEHNKDAFEVWDKARLSRVNQEDALQNYIVFQGARDLNERTSRMKNEVFDREHSKKQQYIRQLHSQLEGNQYRTQNDHKNQREYERRIIEERNQLLSEKDRLIKQSKIEHNKQHLEVLKSQHKPRILLPEKEKVDFPGLGSPVHIGKTLADDRRKQLEWLQKNLYKELSQ